MKVQITSYFDNNTKTNNYSHAVTIGDARFEVKRQVPAMHMQRAYIPISDLIDQALRAELLRAIEHHIYGD